MGGGGRKLQEKMQREEEEPSSPFYRLNVLPIRMWWASKRGWAAPLTRQEPAQLTLAIKVGVAEVEQ